MTDPAICKEQLDFLKLSLKDLTAKNMAIDELKKKAKQDYEEAEGNADKDYKKKIYEEKLAIPYMGFNFSLPCCTKYNSCTPGKECDYIMKNCESKINDLKKGNALKNVEPTTVKPTTVKPKTVSAPTSQEFSSNSSDNQSPDKQSSDNQSSNNSNIYSLLLVGISSCCIIIIVVLVILYLLKEKWDSKKK
jgi:hypothetical protein